MSSYSEFESKVLKAFDAHDFNNYDDWLKELEYIEDPRASVLKQFMSAWVYMLQHGYDQSLSILKELEKHYIEIEDSTWLNRVYFALAISNGRLGHWQLTMDYLNKILDNKAYGFTDHLHKIYRRMGIACYYLQDLERSMEYYNKALSHKDAEKKSELYAKIIGNIANTLNTSGNYLKALEYYKEAEDIITNSSMPQSDREEFVLTCKLNIGIVYNEMENYREAVKCFTELTEFPGSTHTRSALYIYQFRSTAFIELGEYEKALSDLNVAIEYAKQLSLNEVQSVNLQKLKLFILNDKREEADNILLEIRKEEILPNNVMLYDLLTAQKSLREGQLEEAKKGFTDLLNLAEQRNIRTTILAVHEHLRNIAFQLNDLQSYAKHTNAYIKIKDETAGAEKHRQVAVMEKEAEIEAIRIQSEKERAVLYSTLPKHVADRVIAGEKVNDSFESASVLFLDIVGFTKLSAILHADQVVQLLEKIYSKIDEICSKHETTKIKTIGDAYLAVCGIPQAIENHQDKILQAAMEIIAAIRDTKFPMLQGEKVQVRIGLHCGPVSAGVIGSERFQYDVWGDTVNMASRLESTAEAGQIQFSEEFENALTMELQCTKKEMMLKGKGSSVVYFL